MDLKIYLAKNNKLGHWGDKIMENRTVGTSVEAIGVLDGNLNILQMSQRWSELLGRDFDHTKERKFLELINASDKSKVKDLLTQSFQKNSSVSIEIRLKRNQDDAHWLLLHAVPMVERNLIFINANKISPLHDESLLLGNFFTLSPDLFCILDFDGHFIRINPAWKMLLGWGADRLLNKELLSFVHSDDMEKTKIVIANSTEGADTVLFENRLRTVNGTFRWVEWKSVTLMKEKIIFAIARDISSRKKFQEKQRQLEIERATSHAKSLFLSAMSHELRTPLNGIIGSIDLALREANTPLLKELLSAFKVSSESLNKIVNDILEYAAMDSGEIEFSPQPFSLQSLVANLELSFINQAKDKGIALNSEFDLSLPDLLISDANRITQVLGNLLDNAVRFTESGGVIIQIAPSPSSVNHYSKHLRPMEPSEDRIWIRISVIDTGIGISMKQQLKIFDVFSQAAEFINRKKGGLGIGLTVSKHLIELLGGSLEVESKLEKGSTFSFDLPFSLSERSEHSVEPSELTEKPIPPMKILLVEDNVINQKIVLRYLSNQNHSVIVAENGHLGIEAYESNIFDVILMDLQMPEMDGLTATRYIRELEKEGERRTPIVAMTAHAAKSDEEACYDCGMDHFLVKPFRPKALDLVLQKIAINGSFSS